MRTFEYVNLFVVINRKGPTDKNGYPYLSVRADFLSANKENEEVNSTRKIYKTDVSCNKSSITGDWELTPNTSFMALSDIFAILGLDGWEVKDYKIGSSEFSFAHALLVREIIQ